MTINAQVLFAKQQMHLNKKKSYKCSRDDDGWTSITFTLQDGNNLSDCHTYTTPSTTTKATKLKTETKPRR